MVVLIRATVSDQSHPRDDCMTGVEGCASPRNPVFVRVKQKLPLPYFPDTGREQFLGRHSAILTHQSVDSDRWVWPESRASPSDDWIQHAAGLE